MSRLKKYVCSICGEELGGKDLIFAKNRMRSFSTYSGLVSLKAKKLWKRSLSTFFCEKCVSESEKWDKKHIVCINCNQFALNFVGLPNVPEIYCMLTSKGIGNPLKETCEKWIARQPIT